MQRVKFTGKEMKAYLEDMIMSDLATKREEDIYEFWMSGGKITLSDYAYIQRSMNKLYNEKF